MILRLVAALAFICIAEIAAAGDAAGPAQPTYTVEAIRSAHEAWRRRITSLICEGEMTGRVAAMPAGVTRRTRCVFGASHRARYAELQHLRDGLDREDDLDWHRIYLFPDRVAVFWPVNCVANRSEKTADPRVNAKLRGAFCNFYLECSGWWPPGDSGSKLWNHPPEVLARPPCFVLDSAKPVVAPRMETMDARPCIVVTIPRRDREERLWLDIERDFVLTRRHTAFKNTAVEVDVSNDRFKEISPGAWLPRRVRRTITRVEDGARRVEADATFIADRIEMDAPVEKRFVFKPPAGAIVYNYDSDEVERISGGHAILDDLVRVAKKELAVRRSAWRKSPDASATTAIVAALLVGAAPFGVRAVRRRWHRAGPRRAPNSSNGTQPNLFSTEVLSSETGGDAWRNRADA